MPGDDRLEAASSGSPKPRRSPARRDGRSRVSRGSKAASGSTKEGSGVKVAPAAPKEPTPARPRLLEMYHSQVVPTMMQEFGYRNVMEVPRLRKVILNVGLGEALTNPKALESAAKDLTTISGQKPIMTRARKSIAGFKLRQGNTIGVCVTLRGIRMYHFIDRLLNAALPRIRDFRGVSQKSFDGHGNYSMGVREQIVFPEIEYGQIERIRGFQVTFTTTARNDREAERLLALLGMPFAQQN